MKAPANNFNSEDTLENAKKLFNLLDSYLIKDLETMIKLPPKASGGLGYPTIHTIITGMELLGLLMSGKTKEKAFDYFWSNYLEKNFPIYKNFNHIIYNVVRHGTAHFFLIKSGISISKSGDNHLKIHSIDNRQILHINLEDLFNHFFNCYNEIKTKLLKTQNIDDLKCFQSGYNNLINQMQRASQNVENFLKGHPPGQQASTSTSISTSTSSTNLTNYNTGSPNISHIITQPPEIYLNKKPDNHNN